MKKKFLSSLLGLIAFVGVLIVNPQSAEAVRCTLVEVLPGGGSAIYNCAGTLVTVLRPIVVT